MAAQVVSVAVANELTVHQLQHINWFKHTRGTAKLNMIDTVLG